MTIRVYHTQFSAPLPDAQWRRLFEPLPPAIQEQINRYKRWQDQTACLLGKRLLLSALIDAGFSEQCLSDLQYTQYNRPYLDGPGDFNLSHSGEIVVCAISDSSRLGVDVEFNRSIEFQDFQQYMSPTEWHDINAAHQPLERFYHYWTAKESVIKADGRGLSAPLEEVIIKPPLAMLSETTWRLHPLKIAKAHTCHLATDDCDQQICLLPLDFNNMSC
ncbi:MAG: 4'-phosphopantetheinyl transferase superfamily protein [Candidatus Hinthialibacter antarcticus]|nr:4'-phosphopantetheinyl transferase superfamily protein [Candidatus Hinthialibacter antarcticus]